VTWNLALAIAFALSSALLFAISNVVEQRVAARAPEDESMRPKLLVTLFRQPVWLAGFGADVGGYGAQAAALAFGPLLVVAPLGAFGLLFSLLLDAGVNGRRLYRSDLAAAILLCAGLSIFLAIGSPSEGSTTASAASWAPAIVILAAVVAVASLTRRHVRGPARATLFGLASGMTFGVNAALTKVVVNVLGGPAPVSVFWHWELYGVAVLSISGLVMVQSALQAGSLAAALPSMEVAEPVVAAIVGLVILGEHLHAHGTGDRVLIVCSALAMLIGLFALARSRAAQSPPTPAPVDRAMSQA
jgi:drug/metabolite transporter (DMT)-like permease